MSKKPTPVAAGNSEAERIYLRMKEDQERKTRAREEARQPKKVTLPSFKFMDKK